MLLLIVAFLFIFSCAESQTQTSTQSQPQTQPPPDTEIYIAELTRNGEKLEVGKPNNITRRDGYDNQPVFFSNQELFFTSIRENQADIFAIDLKTNQVRQVTTTAESEYSPTLTPDAKFMSVVRVEADQTQRLWKFPLKGGQPTLVLENVKPVGYHVWMDENILMLFILGEPHTLQRADVRTGKAEKITDNIGRSLQKIPGSKNASFVRKNEKDEWWIYEIESSGNIKPIVKAIESEEHDFTWTPSGSIFMAKGSRLYAYTPGKDSEWREIAEIQSVGDITRLAVSADEKTIAFVAQEK